MRVDVTVVRGRVLRGSRIGIIQRVDSGRLPAMSIVESCAPCLRVEDAARLLCLFRMSAYARRIVASPDLAHG